MKNLPQCIWFTGLSGAGKTTIAQAVRNELLAQGRRVYVLDGDLLRTGLNRDLFAQGQFAEVYVDAPLLVCMRRDVKGLYAKAQQGEVPAMTGMGSPYQPPTNPDMRLETGVDTLDNCVGQVMALVA